MSSKLIFLLGNVKQISLGRPFFWGTDQFDVTEPITMAASQVISDQLKNPRKNLTLENVIPLDIELGHGAYGKVFTVKYLGLPCAAKEIHSILLYQWCRPGRKESDQRWFYTRMLSLQFDTPSEHCSVPGRLLRRVV